jgi:hypothetical protein
VRTLLSSRGRHKRSDDEPVSAEHVQVSRALSRGGVALIANSGLTAIFGVIFWVVAARLLTAQTIGRGSALVSLILTVSGLCQLNYARSLSGLIPLASRPRKLLAGVYGLTVALSLVVALATAVVLPETTAGFHYLARNITFIAIFVVSVGLWTIFNLEDAALTSVRSATIVPFENGTYGVLKLVCLYVLWRAGDRGSIAIFAAWVIPLVAVIVPVNLFLFLRAVPPSQRQPVMRDVRSPPWLRYDFCGYLLWLSGTLPLPVLVVIMVGATRAASFYVPFTIATAIDLLSLMLGNSLTAELSRKGGALTRAAKAYLRKVWITVALLSAMVFLAAPYILQAFGDRYRADGTMILRILMLATLPRSVLFLGIAIERSRNNGPSILFLQGLASLGTLGLGLSLAHTLGGVGTALGWLTASCVAAAAALLAVHADVRNMSMLTRGESTAATASGSNRELSAPAAATSDPEYERHAGFQSLTPPDRSHGAAGSR